MDINIPFRSRAVSFNWRDRQDTFLPSSNSKSGICKNAFNESMLFIFSFLVHALIHSRYTKISACVQLSGNSDFCLSGIASAFVFKTYWI